VTGNGKFVLSLDTAVALFVSFVSFVSFVVEFRVNRCVHRKKILIRERDSVKTDETGKVRGALRAARDLMRDEPKTGAGYEGVVDAGIGTVRLDRYIAQNLGVLSRSQIKTRSLSAQVNGGVSKLSRLVRTGDRLALSWQDEPPPEIAAQDIPIVVLYEDDNVIVVDKAQGMVTHPGAGNRSGTLANALLYRARQRNIAALPGGAALRPGIVHRLDKDTSGVLIAAWNTEALEMLQAQFRQKTVSKLYLAIVAGRPPQGAGVVSTYMRRDSADRKRFAVSQTGGKAAVTHYRVLYSDAGYSLLALRPKTGRTHQLRVHLRHLGCPILGDPIYGRKDKSYPQATLMLHARSLSLVLPGAPALAPPSRWLSPLPERFRGFIPFKVE
jgi:23S rRNA pseudouridine1911/1915/1917 synthase